MIALGRLMLSAMFVLAIWLDLTEPNRDPASTYRLLLSYVVLSAAIVAVTWRSWWWDAKLAGPSFREWLRAA